MITLCATLAIASFVALFFSPTLFLHCVATFSALLFSLLSLTFFFERDKEKILSQAMEEIEAILPLLPQSCDCRLESESEVISNDK